MRREQQPNGRVLLIVPASLLGNWQKEAARFTPAMPVEILHGAHAAQLSQRFEKSDAFLTVTTYRMAMSVEALEQSVWDCIILDEAQAIKNPATKQTRQIKKLKSRMRIAMTGTPIENDLSNLWSLFDFLNNVLLGSMTEFKVFCRGLEQRPEGYAKLKSMIAPFLLRRVKTDIRRLFPTCPTSWSRSIMSPSLPSRRCSIASCLPKRKTESTTPKVCSAEGWCCHCCCI